MFSSLATNSFLTYDSIFLPLLPSRVIRKSKKIKRVLIIDDDQEMSHLLQSILQDDSEMRVSIAQDPFDAMDMMTDQAFDFIISEWNLPKLNGLETLLEAEKGFKFEPNLPLEWDNKKVPVIFLSGCEKSKCKPPYTKHFRYLAYISKSGGLENIINNLKYQIQRVV